MRNIRSIKRLIKIEHSIYMLFKNIIIEYLAGQNIDIDDPSYESLEHWKSIKDISIMNMKLEQFVKLHLLRDESGTEGCQDLYEMGSESQLTENECDDETLAFEIVDELMRGDLKNKNKAIYENKVLDYFKRLQERLKKYLKFDLEKFDYNDKKNKIERIKILYFFYTLENIYFPNKDFLMMFGKFSMQNIDNVSSLSFNGMIIRFIKYSLRREIPSEINIKIINYIAQIVDQWDTIIENAYILMDFFEDNGREYDFDKTIDCLNPSEAEQKENRNYLDSPIKALYLKIIQHEYICNIMDIKEIMRIPNNYKHELSQEQILEMQELHNCYVDLDDVEAYIKNNAKKLAKYVYLGNKVTKDDVKRIKSFSKKVSKWIKFCDRIRCINNKEEIANELQIISVLQAIILDSPNESFMYSYYNYEENNNHHADIRVQAALKKDDYVLDILKCYWGRKVADRWYANVGRKEVRTKVRRLEEVCDNILLQILSQPSVEKMTEVHEEYLKKVDLGLISTMKQIKVTMALKDFLNDRGFKYKDSKYGIRYVFSNPEEARETCSMLAKIIDDTIQDKDPFLEVSVPSVDVISNKQILFKLFMEFDYCTMECVLKRLDYYWI